MLQIVYVKINKYIEREQNDGQMDTANMPFPPQISENVWAQMSSTCKSACLFDFVDQHQVNFSKRTFFFLHLSPSISLMRDIKRIVCVQSALSRWVFVAGISTLQLRLVL